MRKAKLREKVKFYQNQDCQKTTPTKGPKKNCVLPRCKSTKYHNEHYKYKKKECLELHHSQHRREKIQELKEKITELYLGKEKTDVEQKRRKYLCESVQGDE